MGSAVPVGPFTLCCKPPLEPAPDPDTLPVDALGAVGKVHPGLSRGTPSRYGLDDADRKDLAQDTVFVAWHTHKQYLGERGSPAQWIAGIAHNAAIDFLRSQARGHVLIGDVAPIDATREATSPEDSVSLSDFANQVLSFLPAEERRVVVLREIEERTFRDIATIRGSRCSGRV
jgi:RNA polymerase sigma-70 factor (ECF subfamily)